MRLRSLEIENFRSIVRTTKLPIDERLTVIVGPNNEGKSNLLRALDLAMACLRAIPVRRIAGTAGGTVFRPPMNFNWLSDFPLQLQESLPGGECRFLLEFELSATEQRRYKKTVGSTTNESLPIEIFLSAKTFRINIRKQRVPELTSTQAFSLSRFISSAFSYVYIPAIRTSADSIQVVRQLVDQQLESLLENDEYREALQKLEQIQKPLLKQIAIEVQTSLKKLLPSVKSVDIGLQERVRRASSGITPLRFIVNDGTATELEHKGDGIKSLVAISLMRASRTYSPTHSMLVAIEEPESHLHPTAIHELSEIISDMSAEHQVVITTHSPLLVSRDHLHANIIVQKSTASPATSIKQIRACLGVKVQDNLSSADFVVLVEGESDSIALDGIFKAASAEFRRVRKNGRLVWGSVGGAGNIPYLLTILRQSVASPVLIADDDRAGREAINRAQAEGKLPSRNIFLLSMPGLKEAELEDHFDQRHYWSELEAWVGATLDLAAFEALDAKWSARMKIVSGRAHKIWNDSIEEEIKAKLAHWVAEDPLTRVQAASLESFRGIAQAIVQMIGAVG